jgi:uncharacterized integral membrane protein (TIGR00698 family)
MQIKLARNICEQSFIIFPGFLVALLISFSAQFISDHYGAPAMLIALLFGIALNFLFQEGKCVEGIEFSARTVLRFGIALLGLRISVEMLTQIGGTNLMLVICGVVTTILFGFIIAPVFGHRCRFAFLSSGSVAICGASAAIAISAILPNDERTEEHLVFTVVGVTVLSTVAMIAYPVLGSWIGFDEFSMGIFLGATIHDVAQVVGAGFSVSEETGALATIVKLIRVAMLAPVILIASMIIWYRRDSSSNDAKRPPLLPFFVLGFITLAILNSFNVIPRSLTDIAAPLSSWALLTAIAAVGMKTSLRDISKVGAPAVALLICQTIFLTCFVGSSLLLMEL